jgi:hypothetical protein
MTLNIIIAVDAIFAFDVPLVALIMPTPLMWREKRLWNFSVFSHSFRVSQFCKTVCYLPSSFQPVQRTWRESGDSTIFKIILRQVTLHCFPSHRSWILFLQPGVNLGRVSFILGQISQYSISLRHDNNNNSNNNNNNEAAKQLGPSLICSGFSYLIIGLLPTDVIID